GDRELGCERHGTADAGRADRAVVAFVVQCGAAGEVGMELPGATAQRERLARRPIARGQAPDAAAVAAPAAGIHDGVRALGERRAPRVLEVFDAAAARVVVSVIPEVDTAVRVIVARTRG